MRNLFRIITLLIFICFIFFAPYVHASSINMNLSNNLNDDENESYESYNSNSYDDDENTSFNFSNNNPTNTTSENSHNPSVTINRSNSEINNELTLSDILSIVIIVIGIILIALGIAILIRCK